jgi:hypothetical protein
VSYEVTRTSSTRTETIIEGGGGTKTVTSSSSSGGGGGGGGTKTVTTSSSSGGGGGRGAAEITLETVKVKIGRTEGQLHFFSPSAGTYAQPFFLSFSIHLRLQVC